MSSIAKNIVVGHKKLDQQRENLLVLAEMLVEMSNDPAADPEVFGDTVFEFAQRAEFHFYQEELFLAEKNYPRLTNQQEAHHRCRDYLLACFANMEQTLLERQQVASFLYQFMVTHITEEDMLYQALCSHGN